MFLVRKERVRRKGENKGSELRVNKDSQTHSYLLYVGLYQEEI